MRDEAIDLCGQINFTRTDAMPLLERDAQFRFTCAGCGNCCRGRISYCPAMICGVLPPGCVCRRRS